MKTILSTAAALATFATAGIALPTAANAQAAPGEIIVFGTDPCPRSTDDEIVVCKRYPESERFRIDPQLRSSGPRQVRESWAKKSEPLKTVGATGIGSCSAVGPGGSSGCLIQEINNARRANEEAEEGQDAPE